MTAIRQPSVEWSGRPVPQPSSLSLPYWEAAGRGELLYMRCDRCGTPFFPPAEACIHCQAEEVAWQRSTGLAAVYSYTVLHAAPSAGFPTPTVLAIVDVEEGYSMFTNVVGCPPADVRIGMAVEVDFEPLTESITLPVFRPARTEESA
jgi:uncharacterized OB-fold protein